MSCIRQTIDADARLFSKCPFVIDLFDQNSNKACTLHLVVMIHCGTFLLYPRNNLGELQKLMTCREFRVRVLSSTEVNHNRTLSIANDGFSEKF